MTTLSYVTTSLNQILTELQTVPFTVSCPTGTLSNIDISGCPISSSGTYGNKTTDGYYATYNITLDQLENIINLQITSQLFSTSNITSTSETVTDNFTFEYVESLKLSGSASGAGEVYIPEYTIYDGCVLWGPTWGKSCWKTPFFGLKLCASYPDGWDCVEKSDITVPSTYSDALLISDSINISLAVNGITGSGTMSYTLSTVNPQIQGQFLFSINITVEGQPSGVFYIYNIVVLDTTITFNSFSLTGGSLTLSTADIQNLLENLGKEFQKKLDDIYANYTFQVNINPID